VNAAAVATSFRVMEEEKEEKEEKEEEEKDTEEADTATKFGFLLECTVASKHETTMVDNNDDDGDFDLRRGGGGQEGDLEFFNMRAQGRLREVIMIDGNDNISRASITRFAPLLCLRSVFVV